jgi:hypothetical protein
MPKATTPVRVFDFAEIEQEFTLAPMTLGFTVYPAVSKRDTGGYSIRVHAGTRGNTDNFDYFYIDDDGTVDAAPRGYAKDFMPGRIPVEQLDAAVAKYAQAVA